MAEQVPPFSELIAATTTSAIHLEMRDAYTPSDPEFLEWKAGKPRPESREDDWWYDLVRTHVSRGVRFRRARVVSEPLADFIRFEYEGTAALNVAAGEEVRWLSRRHASDLCLPGNDFWMFDDRLVRLHHFAGDGEFLDYEFSDDSALVGLCTRAFEAIWERAIPHAEYQPT
jgi:hypothetical protein